jgi:hypothetical protein
MFRHQFRPPAPNDAPPPPSGGGPTVPPVAPPPNPPAARPASQPHHQPGSPGPSGLTPPEKEDVGAARAALREIEARREAAERALLATEARVRAAEQDAVMAAEVPHPDVRRHFRRSYDEYTSDTRAAGQTPVEFDAWYKSDHVRQSPVHSVYFRQPAAPPAAGDPPAPPPPPVAPPARVESGERGANKAPGPVKVSDETIAGWSRDPAGWKASQGKAAREALEQKYGRSIGGGKRFRR